MRIVLINWARFVDGAQSGGGVNGYCRELALELVRLGHEVAWLSGGLSYVAGGLPGTIQPCRVRRMDDDRGVQIYEVVNSPVLAPGIFQFREPLGEIASPELEAELTRFFRVWRPDVVHFHNIEGFSCGCVDAARAACPEWPGAAVFYSLHNYHTICPQVYLMHKGSTPCFDFDGGHACLTCMQGHDTARERFIRAGVTPDAPVEARPPMPVVKPPLLVRAVASIKRRLADPEPIHVPLPVIDPPLPGRAVIEPRDVAAGESATKPPHADASIRPWSQEHFEQASWKPLSNACDPAPASSRAMGDFGLRRKAMIEMLSRCDRVLAVSAFVRRKFESMGVSPRVMREMPIGTRMVEHAQALPWLRQSPRGERRTVRLAFMGYNNAYKGLPMLLDALDLLVPEVLERLELFIWAKDIERDLPRVESLRPRLAALHVRGSYRHEDVPLMLSGIDAGLVPSIWWDNGPQTVMEFLACGVPVIGAALGGIVDLVRHGENGLLFTGNDRFSLASTLARVAREPALLDRLRESVAPPRTMAAHAESLETEYRAALESRRS
jgi:glycosyltransferase involved in cell wall biosynthesis